MTKIYIVGVHHKYQFGPCEAFGRVPNCVFEDFEKFLKDCCIKLDIKTLAEEMHSDARNKWKICKTVPERVAESLQIAHADCDPNEEDRKRLGIRNEGEIRNLGLLQRHSADAINKDILSEYGKREDEWICCLSNISDLPILFICGYEHSESFLKKVSLSGISADLVEREWKPING